MANTVVQYNDHIEMHQQMKILCVVFASSSTSNFKALESCHNTPKQCSYFGHLATRQLYVLLMFHISFFFNDFCQSYYLNFHWMDFHAVFTVRFRCGCRWTIWTSIFEFSRDVAMATNSRFLKFRFFFAITPKRREIGMWSWEKKIYKILSPVEWHHP